MSQTRANYIYIDYENIHEVPLDGLAGKLVSVVLVIGENQKHVPVDFAVGSPYPGQVECVRTGCSGKDALDLVLAYHIGRKAAADPEGHFQIVSRDKAFDALVKHLKTQKVEAARRESMHDIVLADGVKPISNPVAAQPAKKAAKPADGATANPVNGSEPTWSAGNAAALFKKHLMSMKGNGSDSRPKSGKSLRARLQSQSPKKLTSEQVESVIKSLLKGNWLQISPQGAVSYAE